MNLDRQCIGSTGMYNHTHCIQICGAALNCISVYNFDLQNLSFSGTGSFLYPHAAYYKTRKRVLQAKICGICGEK